MMEPIAASLCNTWPLHISSQTTSASKSPCLALPANVVYFKGVFDKI